MAEAGRPQTALGLAALAVSIKRKEKEKMAEEAERAEAASSVHKNHPFFHYYGLLIHQQNMMQDLVRTGAYHSAIVDNAEQFKDKIVVDVGTGSGILAWFAYKAGAKKVYAIEASDVADRAAALLKANGCGDRVVVIKGKVEEVVLPPVEGGAGAVAAEGAEPVKADIIISEPMGFMLIHERMLESYIIARQRFLRPGGVMFPTTGTIFTCPFTDAALYAEQVGKVSFWNTRDFYGLDLTSLAEAASRDHFSQPVVGYIDPSSLLSDRTVDKTIDFAGDAPDSLHVLEIPLDFTVNKTGLCHGLAAWFDVVFPGSKTRVTLNTGPWFPGTHWYQCRLLLREPLAVNAGQRVVGTLRCVANERYSYNLTLTLSLAGSEATTATGQRIQSTTALNLHDQMYHYLQPTAATTAAYGHSS